MDCRVKPGNDERTSLWRPNCLSLMLSQWGLVRQFAQFAALDNPEP